MLHIRSKRTLKAISNDIISRAHKDYMHFTREDMEKFHDLFKELIPMLPKNHFWALYERDEFKDFLASNFTPHEYYYFYYNNLYEIEEIKYVHGSLTGLTNEEVVNAIFDRETSEKQLVNMLLDSAKEAVDEFDWARWEEPNSLNVKPNYIDSFQTYMGFLCGSVKYCGFMGPNKYDDFSTFSPRMCFFESNRFYNFG